MILHECTKFSMACRSLHPAQAVMFNALNLIKNLTKEKMYFHTPYEMHNTAYANHHDIPYRNNGRLVLHSFQIYFVRDAPDGDICIKLLSLVDRRHCNTLRKIITFNNDMHLSYCLHTHIKPIPFIAVIRSIRFHCKPSKSRISIAN